MVEVRNPHSTSHSIKADILSLTNVDNDLHGKRFFDAPYGNSME